VKASSGGSVSKEMELLLPYKEQFVGLGRKMLSDGEIEVTSVASKILLAMSSWN